MGKKKKKKERERELFNNGLGVTEIKQNREKNV